MRRKRKCNYYCNGYCFYHGDTGEVCDTNNNEHEGYCVKEVDKEILNEIYNEMLKAQQELLEKQTVKLYKAIELLGIEIK